MCVINILVIDSNTNPQQAYLNLKCVKILIENRILYIYFFMNEKKNASDFLL